MFFTRKKFKEWLQDEWVVNYQYKAQEISSETYRQVTPKASLVSELESSLKYLIRQTWNPPLDLPKLLQDVQQHEIMFIRVVGMGDPLRLFSDGSAVWINSPDGEYEDYGRQRLKRYYLHDFETWKRFNLDSRLIYGSPSPSNPPSDSEETSEASPPANHCTPAPWSQATKEYRDYLGITSPLPTGEDS